MQPDREYIRARVAIDSETGCWLWQRSLDRDGYGSARKSPVGKRAHRQAFAAFVGPIAEGFQLDHLCRVRHCVNPAHLEPVTLVENVRRGVRADQTKSHCKRGHAYAEHGWINSKGAHRCRLCTRLLSKADYERNRENILAGIRARYVKKGRRRGDSHPSAKLTAADVSLVKTRIDAGESCRSIAISFGVSPSTIERIARGTRWQSITEEKRAA